MRDEMEDNEKKSYTRSKRYKIMIKEITKILIEKKVL